MPRRVFGLLLVFASLAVLAEPAFARAHWKQRIDALIGDRTIGVAVADEGHAIYTRFARRRRVPASNEKLLLTMALFDELGVDSRIVTSAAANGQIEDGVLIGDLWLLGRGDPSFGSARYDKDLPFRGTLIGRLARRVVGAGVVEITGRVIGSTSYFSHDWYALGWQQDFATRYVALPSALSYEGNVVKGRHIDNPEQVAARAFKRRLEQLGVVIHGHAKAAAEPKVVSEVARVTSAPLEVLARFMNRKSSNFFAEVLGKLLGAEIYGPPGTIDKGAAVIEAWASGHGEDVDALDSSGLSYANRASAMSLVNLLGIAEDEPWGGALRWGLPRGGQGTLKDRLAGLKVRAKTGTLDNVSALSGWVWLDRRRSWAEFSILSSGMPKSTASAIEDRIVRILQRRAR
ncbi:MAG TPA: D-alanyl-D-alanine carboxypeptidase [Actinomycetota bacterium]|nr:D-alanyl-D-alanine carboxypeptidase [Actinomycetota bacterium]